MDTRFSRLSTSSHPSESSHGDLEEPLLEKEITDIRQRLDISRARRAYLVQFTVLQAILIAIYTLFFFLLPYGHRSDSIRVYSPAEEAIHLERVRFNATIKVDSPYNGPPSDTLDHEWRVLLANMNIAVPGSDLEKIGAESIKVPNQPDHYIAGLSVFHELHCLKRLRQYTWLDYYYPNMTASEAELNRLHTDHCIEVLRQAIICHADISLFTLQWSAAEPMPRADFSGEHTCTNWQAINNWAGKRKIDDAVMKNLKHPYFGTAFPDGVGSKLGATLDMSPTVLEGTNA